MNKLSYRSSPRKKNIVPDTDKIPLVGSSDSTTESGGSNGFHFPGEPTEPNLSAEQPVTTEHVGLIRDFVETADDLDSLGLEAEADFLDFLIQKFGQATLPGITEEEKYIEYIYKLYNSDIPNSVEKINNLSLSYSKKILDGIRSGLDKDLSKNKAFTSELIQLNMVKTSQYRERDPKYVAEEIAKIIKIIISKMSIEAQNRAKINLKNRVLRLNPNEMTTKQTPAGASIGTSIALIKNILNGRDGYFIKSIIDELVRLL